MFDCADGPRRSGVRGLRDASSQADTQARRHRGDGQSRGTQAGRGRHRNRRGGCPAPLSAALFARPQSDRNVPRKAQSSPSKGRRQINRALVLPGQFVEGLDLGVAEIDQCSHPGHPLIYDIVYMSVFGARQLNRPETAPFRPQQMQFRKFDTAWSHLPARRSSVALQSCRWLDRPAVDRAFEGGIGQ